MKILVPMKRVADPNNANKIKVSADGKLDSSMLQATANPFDEYALETALRLTENGQNTKARLGEVVVVTFGGADADAMLRQQLGVGADRAIRIEAADDVLDGDTVARALKALVDKEKPDVVLLGKQAADGDANQVGQILAELLGWPQATSIGSVKSEGDKTFLVTKDMEDGTVSMRVTLPAVLTTDTRVNTPKAVQSVHSPAGFGYQDTGNGIRYAALMAIMAAKKKPLATVKLAELLPASSPKITYSRYELPPARKAGVKVESVAELVQKLRTEAKVL
ncbi:MAG: electron transfer flavoprotein subunit beta/FixA family protein [Polyangiaceae bacterium]|nr:electron transfer flavoprotein subunit beta/FixA family protein [Polyangiaceae bacterium]